MLITTLILFLIYQTWKSFLAIMSLKKNKQAVRSATPIARIMAYIMLAEGLVYDISLNFIVGTIAFYELPKELLFTNRCSRHLKGANSLRKHRAEWFCKNWLDPYDVGNHCK